MALRIDAVCRLLKRGSVNAALFAAAGLNAGAAGAQALTVLPVTVTLQPRQQAATLALTNGGDVDSSVQIRAFAWHQTVDGGDQLEPTDAIAVSPPIATIAAGHKQIVRFVLRHPPQDREATYRIIVDQIPAAAQPNQVSLALRFSLPIFAEPQTRAEPHLRFGTELIDGKLYLAANNDGKRHESIHGITLRTARGATLAPIAGMSPYVLPGVTRRWPIANAPAGIGAGEVLQLTAKTERSGVIEQTITVGLSQ